jgi:hypothetical protein
MADILITDSRGVEYAAKSGDLLLPLNGNWSAQINFGGIEALPAGQISLSWYDTTYNGYVIRGGIQNAQGTIAAAGGAGGLWKENPTKMYDYSLSAQLPLQEILSDCGEELSPTAEASKLSFTLPNWVRRKVTAGQQVADLVAQMDTYWTLANDGRIYIGDYIWSSANDERYTLQEHDPSLLYTMFNALSTNIRPGQTITVYDIDYKIACVHYSLTETGTTASMWYLDEQITTNQLDPLHAGLASFVRETMSQVDYHALYPGKVVVQRSDGTLDVMLDSKKIPPLTSVPLAYPWPGAKINVEADSRVLIAFRDGDPTQFMAQLYTNGQGGKPVARKGDMVDCGTLSIATIANGGTILYTPPNGTPSLVGSFVYVGPGTFTVTTGSQSVKGLIAEGSSVIEDS